jgi:hypothetical protein
MNQGPGKKMIENQIVIKAVYRRFTIIRKATNDAA